MFDFSTDWKIGVECTDNTCLYIVVPRAQMAEVCRLLTLYWVPYTLDGFVPGSFQVGDPIETIIRINPCSKKGRVQKILDCAP